MTNNVRLTFSIGDTTPWFKISIIFSARQLELVTLSIIFSVDRSQELLQKRDVSPSSTEEGGTISPTGHQLTGLKTQSLSTDK